MEFKNTIKPLERKNSIESMEDKNTIKPLERKNSIEAMEDKNTIKPLELKNSIEAIKAIYGLEDKNIIKALERKNSIESMEDKNTIKPLERKNSIKAFERKNSIESIEDKNTIEAIEDKNTIEAMEDKNTIKAMEDKNTIKPLERKNSIEAMEDKNTIKPLERKNTIVAKNTTEGKKIINAKRAVKAINHLEDKKIAGDKIALEAKQAALVMAEALTFAKKHAIHTRNYKLYFKKDEGAFLHFKKVNNTYIGKLELTIPNPDSYDDIINMLMDPNGPNKIYKTFTDGILSRTYNKNLQIVRQQYKSVGGGWRRYCYALVKKAKLSKDETAVLFVSSNSDSYNWQKSTNHVNPIIKSANIFNPSIQPYEDFRNGISKQMYINLAAFFIKKEADGVKLTYISSIDMNFHTISTDQTFVKIAAEDILHVIKLRNIFKRNKPILSDDFLNFDSYINKISIYS
ncbi:fam-a protein [Plasmodium chabaudi adami]|uniref:Fam-a protein n=1 Tax=Plasmodium chabaudi adami TaxID=5826 RepID=A0A1C6WHY1_PLACE|nr:fam-a protein [Plasmodium chabaudi adami]